MASLKSVNRYLFIISQEIFNAIINGRIDINNNRKLKRFIIVCCTSLATCFNNIRMVSKMTM